MHLGLESIKELDRYHERVARIVSELRDRFGDGDGWRPLEAILREHFASINRIGSFDVD